MNENELFKRELIENKNLVLTFAEFALVLLYFGR